MTCPAHWGCLAEKILTVLNMTGKSKPRTNSQQVQVQQLYGPRGNQGSSWRSWNLNLFYSEKPENTKQYVLLFCTWVWDRIGWGWKREAQSYGQSSLYSQTAVTHIPTDCPLLHMGSSCCRISLERDGSSHLMGTSPASRGSTHSATPGSPQPRYSGLLWWAVCS